VADATDVTQAVAPVAERPGPVHLRLERGQTPVIFDDEHMLDLDSRGVPVLGSATLLARVVLS
jgi:transketolase